jgi:hypothetical protein
MPTLTEALGAGLVAIITVTLIAMLFVWLV